MKTKESPVSSKDDWARCARLATDYTRIDAQCILKVLDTYIWKKIMVYFNKNVAVWALGQYPRRGPTAVYKIVKV